MKVTVIISLCAAACLAAPVADKYRPGYFRPTRTIEERAEASTIPQASSIPKPEVSNIPGSPQVSNIPSSTEAKFKSEAKPGSKIWVGKKHVERSPEPEDWLMSHEWA